MRLVALLAACLAMPAVADYVAPVNGGYVRLEDKPCAHKVVLDLIRDEFHSQFRHGFAQFQGKQLAICWIVSGPGEITLIDSEGDAGVLPVGAFKKVRGV